MNEPCQRNDLVNQRIAWLLCDIPMGLFLIGSRGRHASFVDNGYW
jgi:hypothetical protein